MTNAQKLRIVWVNEKDRRYIPIGYGVGGDGWGIFDQVEQKFADHKIAEIDPTEPLLKS